MTRAEKLTTADVHAALRLRYTQPEWALMFEVAASTGWAGRYADAVSMSMYPSRGLAVHGHEVKVSRSDWGREMKNPDKAEAISRYCDYWWVVTTPGIVKDGELPMGWGLMELQGGRLKIVTKAAQREPVPLDRAFVAAMLRRAHEIDSATVEKLVEAGLEQRTYTLRRAHEAEQSRLCSDKARFDQCVAEVKEKCGLDLYDFVNSDRLASLLKLARDLGLSMNYGPLLSAHSSIQAAQEKLGKASDALQTALTELGIQAAD